MERTEPPRRIDDPINPTDDYTRHKAACETMLEESGLDWVVLRLGAVIPIEVFGVLDQLMFDVPLTDRMEFVHPADVGLERLHGLGWRSGLAHGVGPGRSVVMNRGSQERAGFGERPGRVQPTVIARRPRPWPRCNLPPRPARADKARPERWSGSVA